MNAIMISVKKRIHTDYSVSSEEIELSYKAPEFKVSDRVRITTHINIFSKYHNKNWSSEIFLLIL